MRVMLLLLLTGAAAGAVRSLDPRAQPAQTERRYLYVALPGSDDADPDRSVRMLVFDIANAHRR